MAELLTRWQFLKLTWWASLGAVLASCAPPVVFAPTPVAAPTTKNLPINPIQTSKPLDGSRTVELPLQTWYMPVVSAPPSFAPTATPTREPPVLRAPGPQDAKSWYAPASHFNDVTISGLGPTKVGGRIDSGKYQFIPLVALQAQAIAINPNQLIMGEGASELINVYSIIEGGKLVFQGVLLPYVLARASISGRLQDEIEGPMTIPTRGGIRVVNRSDVINSRTSQNVRVNISSSPRQSSLEGSLPKDWSIDISDNPFPPEDWKPPDRNNCGQDMTEYFTTLLLQETLSGVISSKIDFVDTLLMSKEQYRTFLSQTPILRGYEEIAAKQDQLGITLKEKDCYFYPEGGSTYADYKLMRARARLKAGGYSNPNLTSQEYAKIWNKDQAPHLAWRKGINAIKNMFDENMTTEQAYQLARRIVEQYWW